jgi:hypothetical protein
VAQNIIENYTIAQFTYDHAYISYYMHPERGGPSPELKMFPPADIQHMRDLLESNYDATVLYRGTKATCVVDLSETGIIEWWNMKAQARPEWHFDLRRIIVMYLQYTHDRWFIRDIRWVNQPEPVPEGWPAVPQEIKESAKSAKSATATFLPASAQNSPSLAPNPS